MTLDIYKQNSSYKIRIVDQDTTQLSYIYSQNKKYSEYNALNERQFHVHNDAVDFALNFFRKKGWHLKSLTTIGRREEASTMCILEFKF